MKVEMEIPVHFCIEMKLQCENNIPMIAREVIYQWKNYVKNKKGN